VKEDSVAGVNYLPNFFVKYDNTVSESELLAAIDTVVEKNLGKKTTERKGDLVNVSLTQVTSVAFDSLEDSQQAIRLIESIK
jgi:hypothetical protein